MYYIVTLISLLGKRGYKTLNQFFKNGKVIAELLIWQKLKVNNKTALEAKTFL